MNDFEPHGIVVPSDPSWPAQFEAERSRLRHALRQWLASDIQHIGSTSVPGMSAKPILDLMAGVASLSDAEPAALPLAELGYQRRPHRVDAVLFVRTEANADTHNLQLTLVGSELWRERLAFRDALRADPALLAEYTELKRRLLAEAGGQVYQASGKRDFVRRVLAGAGHELRDGLHVRADRSSH